MQLINKYNKVFQSLLCVINFFSKYAWVMPLKYKDRIAITSTFQNVLNESGRKPNKNGLTEVVNCL